MTTTPSLSHANAFGIAKTAFSLRDRVSETVREWRRRSRSRRDLLTLGERELSDVRLTRTDAVWEANKPFWRE